MMGRLPNLLPPFRDGLHGSRSSCENVLNSPHSSSREAASSNGSGLEAELEVSLEGRPVPINLITVGIDRPCPSRQPRI